MHYAILFCSYVASGSYALLFGWPNEKECSSSVTALPLHSEGAQLCALVVWRTLIVHSLSLAAALLLAFGTESLLVVMVCSLSVGTRSVHLDVRVTGVLRVVLLVNSSLVQLA